MIVGYSSEEKIIVQPVSQITTSSKIKTPLTAIKLSTTPRSLPKKQKAADTTAVLHACLMQGQCLCNKQMCQHPSLCALYTVPLCKGQNMVGLDHKFRNNRSIMLGSLKELNIQTDYYL